MNERTLFRSETLAEVENTLSRFYIHPDLRKGYEIYAFVGFALVLASSFLFVNISLDVTATGIFRANTNNRIVVADRDGILAYTISNRLPVNVEKGSTVAVIKNFDPVTLRQAPSVAFNKAELEGRRLRVLARQQTAENSTADKVKSLRLMQSQLKTLEADTDNLITVYRADVERLRKREDDYKALLAKGLITSQVLENASENGVERTFQLNSAETSGHEYERRMTELEFQLQQTVDDANKEQLDLGNQLTSIDVAMKADAELEEEPLHAESSVTLIPKGFSTGQVVKKGDALFEVNAKADALEVEADVPENQVGEIHEGMPVTIGVNSYPFFKYGMISGTVAFVSSVSTDTVTFSDQLPTNSQFRMIIKPDSTSLSSFSEGKKILPGMLTEVHVRRKKVAVWRLLLSPLLHLGYRTDI